MYDKHHATSDMHWIDYGLGGLTGEALRVVDEREGDLAVLYQRLAQTGSLYGFLATERFYEIGTPERAGGDRGVSDRAPAHHSPMSLLRAAGGAGRR